jgi:peroxiredoxin
VVLAVSIDAPDAQRRLTDELRLTFPLLSDPQMSMIRAYGMKGDGMAMADMGYVIVDKRGRIRARESDRRFGDNVAAIVRAVHAANAS